MTDLILLAAGASRRFGSQKLLAEFEGKPLYRRAFEAAAQVKNARVVVVTRAGLLDTAAAEVGFDVVLVDDGLPQSASVAAGARSARPGADLCFFVCDQPHFPGAALDGFVEKFRRSGKALGRVRAGETFGSPTIFASKFRSDLLELSGDQGARALFRGREAETFVLEVPGEFLLDYDTPLARLRAMTLEKYCAGRFAYANRPLLFYISGGWKESAVRRGRPKRNGR